MRIIIDIEPEYYTKIKNELEQNSLYFTFKVFRLIAEGLVIPDDFLKNSDLKKLMELSTVKVIHD